MYAIGLVGGLGSTPNSAETAKVTVRFRTPHPTASKATNRQFYAAMVSSRSTPSLQQHADHRPTQRRSARNHCCAKWGHPTARRCRNRMAARSPPTPASADASAKQNGSSAQLFFTVRLPKSQPQSHGAHCAFSRFSPSGNTPARAKIPCLQQEYTASRNDLPVFPAPSMPSQPPEQTLHNTTSTVYSVPAGMKYPFQLLHRYDFQTPHKMFQCYPDHTRSRSACQRMRQQLC